MPLSRRPRPPLYGLDLNVKAVEYCRKKKDLDVRLGTVEDYSIRANHFDIVTYWMVLEHAIDPKRELERVKYTLRPGGLLCVQVPNISMVRTKLISLLRRHEEIRLLLDKYRISTPNGLIGSHILHLLDPLHHLQGFNVKALVTLLCSLDFQNIEFHISYTDRSNRLLNWPRLCVFAPFYVAGALNHRWLSSASITVLANLRHD